MKKYMLPVTLLAAPLVIPPAAMGAEIHKAVQAGDLDFIGKFVQDFSE